jgi:hydroxymethylglutaryl-CoA synthase
MAGITSYGAYIPLYRLSRAEISKAWGIPGAPGEKAVANYDEDSLTMAVAACLDCIGDMNRQQIDGLFLATTTSPYKEKQVASIVAKAIDLRPNAITADYVNSLRGGTLALKAALDAVTSGSAKQVLVVASDRRPSAAQGPREYDFGDGAAALLVGASSDMAKVIGSHTIYNNMVDVWRTENDRFVRSWEERFIIDKGYINTMRDAASAVMGRCGLSSQGISRAVLYSPDLRSHQNLARALGFDLASQVQDSLYSTVGNTGTALTLMMLVSALEEAKPGDKMLVASYGDGSDSFILEATGGKAEGRRGVKGHLAKKKLLPNYEAYARLHGLIPIEPLARPPKLVPSSVIQWRESNRNLALYGAKCNRCGMPQYPAEHVCVYCQSWDDFTPYRFSDKKATLFAYSFDNLAFAVTDVPPVGCSITDFDGGGRMMCHLVDCDPNEVRIGMPLEMTFRIYYQAEGVPVYCWKSRPVR